MFEKIKDFFYNINDLIVAVLIIALASYVITWKIGDILSYPDQVVAQGAIIPPHASEYEDDLTEPDFENSQDNDLPDEVETPPLQQEPDETIDETPSSSAEEDEEDDIDDTPTQPINKITIDIPSGTSGVSIAKMIQEKGLISSTSEFLNRLEERKLDVKLRAGKFNIPENASIDEIINILTGQ